MAKATAFLYFCANCGSPATKKALKNLDGWAGKRDTPKDFDGLGGWRCAAKCGSGIKVRREKNHD